MTSTAAHERAARIFQTGRSKGLDRLVTPARRNLLRGRCNGAVVSSEGSWLRGAAPSSAPDPGADRNTARAGTFPGTERAPARSSNLPLSVAAPSMRIERV